jgi:hypothetical protein
MAKAQEPAPADAAATAADTLTNWQKYWKFTGLVTFNLT